MQVILQADQRQKQNHKDVLLPAHPQKTFPMGERTWIDVEPGKYSLSEYPKSKKLIYLLRHGSLPRDNDGAIEFWRIKDYLQAHFVFCHHWSDDKWKKSMAGGGGHKKVFQYCTDSSGAILYLRALQGHSGRNLLDPYYRTMSWFQTVSSSTFITSDVQSIYIPSSIQDWYREDKIWANDRQYSLCLLILWTKNARILTQSTLGAPRRAQYMHEAWKKHQNKVYWVDINLTEKERIEVLSDTKRHHSSRNTPSLLYPESYNDRNHSSRHTSSLLYSESC